MGSSKSPRSRISAGLLMFRRRKNKLEVLLAHPGGPFHVHKDDGAWTIPKGEAAPGEDLLTRAQIEFEEEVGFRPESSHGWIELGSIIQKGGKTEVARRKLKPAQVPLLDRLRAAIKG